MVLGLRFDEPSLKDIRVMLLERVEILLSTHFIDVWSWLNLPVFWSSTTGTHRGSDPSLRIGSLGALAKSLVHRAQLQREAWE